MRKESLDNYMELQDQHGMQTLFRKFETETWIFQFNEKGEHVGQVCVSAENMKVIRNAPSLKPGDAKSKQTL